MEQRYGTDPSKEVWNGGMERVWSRSLFRTSYFDLHPYRSPRFQIFQIFLVTHGPPLPVLHISRSPLGWTFGITAPILRGPRGLVPQSEELYLADNSNGKLHKLLAMIVLKPCNHWHLYMTLRYTMIYSKRVQLDHIRPILHAYVDRFSIAESVAEVTGQLKALALPRSFWDRFIKDIDASLTQ